MVDELTKGTWVHVGQVGVDAGFILISDATEAAALAVYKAWDDNMFRTEKGVAAISAVSDGGVFNGVICESGGSDGDYDVYVRRQDFGHGEEVTGVFVDCTSREE